MTNRDGRKASGAINAAGIDARGFLAGFLSLATSAPFHSALIQFLAGRRSLPLPLLDLDRCRADVDSSESRILARYSPQAPPISIYPL
jgi:hypothetical protein